MRITKQRPAEGERSALEAEAIDLAGARPSVKAMAADPLVKKRPLAAADLLPGSIAGGRRPTREEAEAAVRTLIEWAGDDPGREGLADTPKRVVEAFGEWFAGYHEDPIAVLGRTFEEVHGYDDMVMLRDIRIESHCEHHIAPFIGVAHVAYLPQSRVVGISKLARVVEIFAKRLQTQETMTAQVADAIEQALRPKGTAVLIEAEHQCMSTRGVHKPGVAMITTRFTGAFKSDPGYRDRFLRMVQGNKG